MSANRIGLAVLAGSALAFALLWAILAPPSRAGYSGILPAQGAARLFSSPPSNTGRMAPVYQSQPDGNFARALQGSQASATPTVTVTATPTATSLASRPAYLPLVVRQALAAPTATATPSRTPTPTVTASRTITPSPTSTVTPSPTPSATATSTQTPVPPLFFDGFDDPNSGWGAGENAKVQWGYLEGEYQIAFRAADYGLLTTPNLSLPANYRIEVDAREVSNNPVSLGLAFDIVWSSDSYAVYQFLVYPEGGEYLLEKRSLDGTWDTLIDWTPDAAVNPNNDSNHLRVDRAGSGIWLYINGVNVNSYDDGELAGPGRDAGLRAYDFADVPAETRFDNFRASLLP
jgi:hypothetical protein